MRKMNTMPEEREELKKALKGEVKGNPFSDLFAVTMSSKTWEICGEGILDALEERGVDLSKVGAVGALSPAGVPLVGCCMAAAKKRGLTFDGFSMDFVYPSLKGPSVEGKNVVLIDAWISDLGYIQTSSLVTLTEHQELELDWSIVKDAGAHVLAVASLVAGSEEGRIPEDLDLKDVNTGEEKRVPFAYTFCKKSLEG